MSVFGYTPPLAGKQSKQSKQMKARKKASKQSKQTKQAKQSNQRKLTPSKQNRKYQKQSQLPRLSEKSACSGGNRQQERVLMRAMFVLLDWRHCDAKREGQSTHWTKHSGTTTRAMSTQMSNRINVHLNGLDSE